MDQRLKFFAKKATPNQTKPAVEVVSANPSNIPVPWIDRKDDNFSREQECSEKQHVVPSNGSLKRMIDKKQFRNKCSFKE